MMRFTLLCIAVIGAVNADVFVPLTEAPRWALVRADDPPSVPGRVNYGAGSRQDGDALIGVFEQNMIWTTAQSDIVKRVQFPFPADSVKKTITKVEVWYSQVPAGAVTANIVGGGLGKQTLTIELKPTGAVTHMNYFIRVYGK